MLVPFDRPVGKNLGHGFFQVFLNKIIPKHYYKKMLDCSVDVMVKKDLIRIFRII